MLADLTNSLQSCFGFTSFRPGQSEAIHSLLGGQHTLVVMPTGSGKSLIYQFAALLHPGITLVISPLIALMKDQVDSLARFDIPASFINSTLPMGEQNKRLKILARGGYRLVYVAPERLHNAPFLEALRQQKICQIAVDEAHCISEWGHDFRPDYLYIASFREKLDNPLTIALTATATPQVQDDICRLLGLPETHRVITGFNRENLFFEVRYTSDTPAKLHALQEMVANQEDGATIVYVGTRRDAEEVSEFLKIDCRYDAHYYHAGLTSEQRTYIQDAFISGSLPVVVATNAFGMGIDRPDVRQVIHYALPGSIESYYQEAGRGGRDGLKARAVLLYDPKDRALQEFFIKNSVVTQEELRRLYQVLDASDRNGAWMTSEEFSRITGLPEVKVRVGLGQLERFGVIERLGDEGLRMLMRRGDWNLKAISAIETRVIEMQRHRRNQLDRMIAYAETNQCRRQKLLEHFGDRSQTGVSFCCDNCQVRQSFPAPNVEIPQLDEHNRISLVIMDTVRRLRVKVGREKLALILKGSRAAEILKYHYDKTIYYGRLSGIHKRKIEGIIEELITRGYLKVIGGKYPVLSLTPQGEIAIQQKSNISSLLTRHISSKKIANKRAVRRAGRTIEYTAQLHAQGLNPEQIALQRNLALGTIYTHLARLISTGKVTVESVVPEIVRHRVEDAIQQVGATEHLAPIKSLLPEEIDFGVIRCVVEGWKINHIPTESRSPIDDFLSRSHPRQLTGPWHSGWALGFHSSFSGSEWNRSAVGELTYRLKYQEDLSVLPALVEMTVAHISDHPELVKVDVITPVPPSIPRPNDPVAVFAVALSKRLEIAVLPILAKTRQTSPQKEMRSLAQKRANVTGAFAVTTPIKGKRLLIVDDLFDSGATMVEITRVLLHAGAAEVNVLALTRTIHSDA